MGDNGSSDIESLTSSAISEVDCWLIAGERCEELERCEGLKKEMLDYFPLPLDELFVCIDVDDTFESCIEFIAYCSSTWWFCKEPEGNCGC